ncbi:hypothetical protein PPTG_00776 [Phytophthora nicotianae INRA-310]|uniref:Uncharacterized protein n=1 Tax=Phytophthora nicotianae (strain INRA-310) TaxID=761204 RepID=W2RGD5_PHYN3|nr:hypothetical protein PPTG_00776 [Phytophthora nicotianae INRA-310]ETN24457.1 hypothetical protein PPTG_00776 [Phytophthora nicotianae INRA-310]
MSARYAPKSRTRKTLTPTNRATIVAFLLSVRTALQPPRGSIIACAAKYGCSDGQISRLWRRAVQGIKAGKAINYDSGKEGKSGRKFRITKAFCEDLNSSIKLIPLEDRIDIRALVSTLSIPKSPLNAYNRAGVFRSHTTRVKQMLTEKQHVDQVKFALGFVHRGPRNTLLFDSMMDYVHLDEKWLYLLKEKQRFYLGEHEAVPHITVKNKNFIIKVMFLVAVARPRCDAKRHRVWDGKSLQYKKKAKTIEDLVDNVDTAFEQLDYLLLTDFSSRCSPYYKLRWM